MNIGCAATFMILAFFIQFDDYIYPESKSNKFVVPLSLNFKIWQRNG